MLGAAQLSEWWLVDDHPVATTYWIAAVGVSRLAQRPADVLRFSARLLVASLFALAFGWKLLSTQFTSGTFFEYTLVRDPRFEPVAVIVRGGAQDDLDRQRSAISAFTVDGEAGDVIELTTAPGMRSAARVFTWLGLVLEGLVATAFLMPLPNRLQIVRTVALIAFCVMTYSVIPVAGFALLLLTMGLAQARSAAERRVHLIAGILVLAWNAVLAGLIL